VEPNIFSNSDFEVIIDNKIYNIPKGTTKDYRFKLKTGVNNITLKGNGVIEFLFRKEVL
jgi:hypothetical protein